MPDHRFDVAPITCPLPTCTPDLMPFHISYTGSAPIATFFRAKETKPAASTPAAPKLAGTDSKEGAPTPKPDAAVADAAASPSPEEGTTQKEDEPAVKRYTAAFRGRTVQGREVALPEGYAGLVLRADAAESSKTAKATARRAAEEARGKGKGRSTRRSGRGAKAVENVVDEDEDDLGAADLLADEPALEVKTFRPTSTFSSLVVWNPDIPADEGRDEYIRAMKEWTCLAGEVSEIITIS